MIAAEVVSGEEFEEEDNPDNFYLQMQKNIKIMELLKEAGYSAKQSRAHMVNKGGGLFKKSNTKSKFAKKPSSCSPNKENKPKTDDEIESLFSSESNEADNENSDYEIINDSVDTESFQTQILYRNDASSVSSTSKEQRLTRVHKNLETSEGGKR